MNDKKYSNFFLSVTCRCNNNQNIFPYYYFWLCVNSAHFIRKILYLFFFFCWTHNISRLLPLEFCNRVWQVQFRYQRKKKICTEQRIAWLKFRSLIPLFSDLSSESWFGFLLFFLFSSSHLKHVKFLVICHLDILIFFFSKPGKNADTK